MLHLKEFKNMSMYFHCYTFTEYESDLQEAIHPRMLIVPGSVEISESDDQKI